MGELAAVTLRLPATAPAPLLPNAAIKRHPGQTGAWRLVDGQAAFVALRLGRSGLDGQVQVLEGIDAGDRVVVYSEKEIDANSCSQVVERLVRGAP